MLDIDKIEVKTPVKAISKHIVRLKKVKLFNSRHRKIINNPESYLGKEIYNLFDFVQYFVQKKCREWNKDFIEVIKIETWGDGLAIIIKGKSKEYHITCDFRMRECYAFNLRVLIGTVSISNTLLTVWNIYDLEMWDFKYEDAIDLYSISKIE